jgi:lysosomal Pro-X carboxypeptidase
MLGEQAMGNFPYATGYILNNAGVLPAYPVRVACKHLAQPNMEGEDLLSAFADAVGVFYNHSDHLPCFDYK